MKKWILRFVGLTHSRIEILLTTFRTDYADIHQVDEDWHSQAQSIRNVVNKISIPSCVSLTNLSTSVTMVLCLSTSMKK